TREARSASIVWPVQPGQNIPTVSRIDHSLMLAVRPGAPWSLSGVPDKPALPQGEKGALKVTLTRISPDFKTPLTVQAIQTELPKGLTLNNNQPITIAANATEGSLPINVPPNVPPGTYTLVLNTQTQMPYNKDPMAKQKPNTIVVLPSEPISLTILPKSLANVPLSTPNATVKIGAEAEGRGGVRGGCQVPGRPPPKAQGGEDGRGRPPRRQGRGETRRQEPRRVHAGQPAQPARAGHGDVPGTRHDARSQTECECGEI